MSNNNINIMDLRKKLGIPPIGDLYLQGCMMSHEVYKITNHGLYDILYDIMEISIKLPIELQVKGYHHCDHNIVGVVTMRG